MTTPKAPGGKPNDPPVDPAANAKGRVDAVHSAALALGVAKGAAVRRAEPLIVATRYGEVRLASVERREDDKGVAWIEIWLDGATENGETHFRIFNPPMLAQDPAGSVTIAGTRYRHDPLAGIAEAIAANGGRAR